MLIVSLLFAISFSGNFTFSYAQSVQKENSYMAGLKVPDLKDYEFKDWKQTTIDFLDYVLDESNVYDEHGTNRKIARFTTAKNIDAYFNEKGNKAWSIPPYIGKGGDNELGEGITVIAAVMSGALVGMDMANYKGKDGNTYNLVKSCVEYYQAENGNNLVLNGGAGGSAGVTFWYELLPGVLFSVLASTQESEKDYMYDIITEMARKWFSAVVGMGGASADFYHTSYNFNKNEPYDNGVWYEPDAAAGIAYILYSAYNLNVQDGNNSYATDDEIEMFRQGAIWSMDYLERIEFSPFYEVLTFLAPYLAARMNAQEGTNYNVAKMINWTLDGSSQVRGGWGMIDENWGSHYTMGLMGSLSDGGGYAFAMNTFDAMLGFAPMVKYDTRFANDIAKWVLCVSQSAKEYYPENYDLSGEYKTYGDKTIWHGYTQSGKWIAPDDERASFIPYEGLRKKRRYVTYDSSGKRGTAWDDSRSPYASGDAFTFDWGGDTDYGLYGASHVGLFGSTIFETNVPMILRTDLNALDVFNNTSDFTFNMYFNPYTAAKDVEVTLTVAGNQLYDTINKRIVNTQTVAGSKVKFSLGANETVILAEIPSGAKVVKNGSIYSCNGIFLAQERGSADLKLYDGGGNVITNNASVSGDITAKIDVKTPSGSDVENIRLSFAGTTLYEGKTAPSNNLVIDTKTLRNGTGTMTLTLELSGGAVEKSTVNLRVMNVVKTPAISYASPQDMSDKWNSATAKWQTDYPKSDHLAITAPFGNGIKITENGSKDYGFATSELFYLDFSREPIIELNVTSASNEYAIKVFVDGMSDMTGGYIVRDTGNTGKIELNILEELRKEDRTFNREGAHLAAIKIAPTGGEGASITVEDFTVYHMYTTPVLDEPKSYEWGFDFPSVWLSLWSGDKLAGGEGAPTFKYNDKGESIISGKIGYNGVASPLIETDLSQNPVLDSVPKEVSGAYFVGVRFDGDSQLYILADNIKSNAKQSVEIMSSMRRLYPDVKKSGVVKMRIVVGAVGDSAVTFGKIDSYYKLPEWGTAIEGAAWADWEKQNGVSALGTLTMDTAGRAVIKNNDARDIETSIAGMSGKFTLNFDLNPELGIIVRQITGGEWRLTLTPFNSNTTYALTDFTSSASRNEIKVNVNSRLGGILRGEQSVYINLEVKGGQNAATVEKIRTHYTVIQPKFGSSYTTEIATWERTPDSSIIFVNSLNQVIIKESAPDSRGIISPALSVSKDFYPIITVNIASLSEDSVWYLKAQINGKNYLLTPNGGSQILGDSSFDLRAASGIKLGEPFDFTIELGGSGELFEVGIKSLSFMYRLGEVTEASFNESSNSISFKAPVGAASYNYSIENSGGVVKVGSSNTTTINLADMNLPTGVYNMYITASADGYLTSQSVRRAFKQGDIASVQLGDVSNYRIKGTTVLWDKIDNVESYFYTLYDSDNNRVISSGNLKDNKLDMIEFGLNAFNHRLEVKSVGDDAVYLSGGTTTFKFFTNIAARFTPKSFETMTSGNNKGFATVDENTGAAVLQVPDSGNWGDVISLPFSLNFDKNPLLELDFGEQSEGGYHIRISIMGTEYHLTDDTYNFDDTILDINEILATREDGAGTPITGTKNVTIRFGATGGKVVATPKVYINSSRAIELVAGEGTPYFGELAKPSVSINGLKASWNAVQYATGYTVVIKNEFGQLKSETISGLEYDLSFLTREGDYVFEVTAIGANYYNSETSVSAFKIFPIIEEQAPGCIGCGSISLFGGGFFGGGMIILLGILIITAAKRKKSDVLFLEFKIGRV